MDCLWCHSLFFYYPNVYLCVDVFFLLVTQNHEIFWTFLKPETGKSQKSMFWFDDNIVTTSVLNKEGLPGTSAKTVWAKRSGGMLERLTRWRRSDVPDVPPYIYIYRYLANKQFFSLVVNTFIHWIFNVVFNPVHYYCHPFTNFYKRLIYAEFKPFFIVRKSNTLIFWKVCLLVVPVGFDPRIYNIKTLHFNNSVDNVPSTKRFQTSGGFWKQHVYLSKTTKPHVNTFGGAWGS